MMLWLTSVVQWLVTTQEKAESLVWYFKPHTCCWNLKQKFTSIIKNRCLIIKTMVVFLLNPSYPLVEDCQHYNITVQVHIGSLSLSNFMKLLTHYDQDCHLCPFDSLTHLLAVYIHTRQEFYIFSQQEI